MKVLARMWVVCAALHGAAVWAQGGGLRLESVDVAGRRTEVAWSTESELRAVRMTTQIGERDPSEVGLRLIARGAESVRYVEHVLAVGATGIEDLRRTYLEATASLAMHDPTAEVGAPPLGKVTLRSDLAGVSVREVRAPNGKVGRHYDGPREAREALLAHVRSALDLRPLLPTTEVTLGDQWTVPPGALVALFAPTGELGWRSAEENADPQLVRSFQQGLGGNLQLGFAGMVTGEAQGQLFEVVIAGGERRATLRFTFDVTLASDGTEFARRRALDNERDQGVQVVAATALLRLKGTAEVVWSVEGRRALGATADAEERVSLSIRVQPEDGELARQTVEFDGRCKAALVL